MMQNKQTELRILPADLMCECKITGVPSDPSHFLHNHDGCEIFLLLEGDINFYTQADGKRLKRGDLICMRSYDFHRGELLSPNLYSRITINIRDGLLKSLSTEKTDLSSCFYYNSSKNLNIFRLKEEEIARFTTHASFLEATLNSYDFGSDILADTYIKQILVMINRLTVSQNIPNYSGIMPELVADTCAYIEDHLTGELSLQGLAGHLHHNGTYVSRCFKNIMGISLQQYIIAKRVVFAQKLLREGHSPSDVCYMTGFNNYSNFSRTFSKQSDCSPKQYQLKYKGLYSFS